MGFRKDKSTDAKVINTVYAQDMDPANMPEYNDSRAAEDSVTAWIRMTRESLVPPTAEMSDLHLLACAKEYHKLILTLLERYQNLHERHSNLARYHYCASSEKSIPGQLTLADIPGCPEELKKLILGNPPSVLETPENNGGKNGEPPKDSGEGRTTRKHRTYDEKYKNAETAQELILLPDAVRQQILESGGRITMCPQFAYEELVCYPKRLVRRMVFKETYFCEQGSVDSLVQAARESAGTVTVNPPVLPDDDPPYPGITENSDGSASSDYPPSPIPESVSEIQVPAVKLPDNAEPAMDPAVTDATKTDGRCGTTLIPGRGYSAGTINGGTVVRAEGPPRLLPGSHASTELVSSLMCDTILMSLPAYRLSADFERHGVPLDRGKICQWMIQCSHDYLQPMALYIHSQLLERDVLCADETIIQVLKEPGKTPEQKSYCWILLSVIPGLPKLYFFKYAPTREAKHAEELLEDFSGYLLTDRYAGYNHVGTEGQVIHVYCAAHARRKFLDACGDRKDRKLVPKKQWCDCSPAEKGFLYIDALFKLERGYKGMTPEERKDAREKNSRPVLDEFWKWLDTVNCTSGSSLERAVNYVRAGKDGFYAFLSDGRIELSNNGAENCARGIKIQCKNWLFRDTVNGAEAVSTMATVLKTAEANGLDVDAYLQYLMETTREYYEFDEKTREEGLAKAMPHLAPWNENIQRMFRIDRHQESIPSESGTPDASDGSNVPKNRSRKPVMDLTGIAGLPWLQKDFELNGNTYVRRKLPDQNQEAC